MLTPSKRFYKQKHLFPKRAVDHAKINAMNRPGKPKMSTKIELLIGSLAVEKFCDYNK
jgi:hypothetical protein